MMRNADGRFKCPNCGREYARRCDAFDCRDSHAGGISLADEAASYRGADRGDYR